MDPKARRLILSDDVPVEVSVDPQVIGTTGAGSAEDDLVGGVDTMAAFVNGGMAGLIRRFAEAVEAETRALGHSTMSVEFGVGLKASGAIPFLVTGAGESTVKVTITWNRP